MKKLHLLQFTCEALRSLLSGPDMLKIIQLESETCQSFEMSFLALTLSFVIMISSISALLHQSRKTKSFIPSVLITSRFTREMIAALVDPIFSFFDEKSSLIPNYDVFLRLHL